jgi:cytoskeleton protein RodZ
MAPTIGETLRQARSERGDELSDVEQATKIRVKFLEAMEDDRWDALPAPAYARGFLDIYVRYLGLDRDALLDEYRRTVEGERHESIPKSVIKPGTLRQTHTPRPSSVDVKPVAKVLAGVLVLIVIGLVIVGSIGGSDNGGGGEKNKAAKRNRTAAAGPTPTTGTTTTPAGEVSVELRATDLVWVCLVDDSGTPVVNSETLSADDVRGPFRGDGFDVTFGNGSVEMTVDGAPERVPPVAEPIGYRITPSGIRTLDPSSQPTCT